MKKYKNAVDGRRDPLTAEFNESNPPIERPTAPQADPAPKRKRPEAELTVEIGRAIVGAIAAGNFPSVACRLSGVAEGTLDKWLKHGDKGKQPYADFTEAYRRAELEGESAMVEIWKNAAPEDWRAAKEFLAKRHPERWSDHAARRTVLGDEERMAALGFQIIIHTGVDWDEQRRQRALELEQQKQTPAIDITPKPAAAKDPDPSLN